MTKKKQRKKSLPVDARSIRKLPADTDFSELFGANSGSGKTDFTGLVDEHLAQVNLKQVLSEKQQAFKADAATNQSHRHYPAPQAFLDLHGFTAPEAEKETMLFLHKARQAGLLSVCIITGKGLHSDGEGVLRDLTEALLVEQKKKQMIFSYRWEKKNKEKSGAVIVHLR